jgi:hypothetical protein
MHTHELIWRHLRPWLNGAVEPWLVLGLCIHLSFKTAVEQREPPSLIEDRVATWQLRLS